MTEPREVQAQLDTLAREVQVLREERVARARSFRRLMTALVSLTAAATLVVGVRSALAAGACAQTLPAPLTTFCADDPALAGQVNGNFQQLVNWVQQKVGTVGSANVTVGGKLSANGGLDVLGDETVSGNQTVGTDQTVSGTSAISRLVVNNGATLYGPTDQLGRLTATGLTIDGTAKLCLTTYDCTSHTDSCGTGSCPAGKFVTSVVMPTSCAGTSNHSVTCCRLKLVGAVSSGVCP